MEVLEDKQRGPDVIHHQVQRQASRVAACRWRCD
jgi:hypothetical protein